MRGPLRAQFAERLQRAHREWSEAVSRIPEAAWVEPGSCGSWSCKDLIAHISWYEREMITMLETRRFSGSSLWDLPPEERNQAIFEQNRDRSLEAVQAEARHSHERLIELLEALDEHELTDPGAFPGMPADWKPWHVLAGNTYEHYEDHLADARRLRIE